MRHPHHPVVARDGTHPTPRRPRVGRLLADPSRLLGAVAVLLALLVLPARPGGAEVEGLTDLRGDEYYAAAVAWMAGEGLTTGVGDTGRYEPDGTTTRAQLVTFLWRLAGRPGGHPTHGFADVPPATYYESALRWAKATGLTTGVGGLPVFLPDGLVTRAEMATLLWRFDGEPWAPPNRFVDVPRDVYYARAVDWMAVRGLTTGVGGSDRFAPDDTLTRGQLATFVWRYSGEPAPPNPGDTRDCGDFATRADAGAWYGLYAPHYGDVARLDVDGDGEPCEGLPESTPAGTGVLCIGDSVMLGASPAHHDTLSMCEVVDAVQSRQMSSGAAVVQGHLAGWTPTAVVVHLGTNGSTLGVDALLAELTEVPQVVLVDVRGVDRADQLNAELEAAAARWPNTVVARWSDWSAGRTTWFWDGIHLTASGADGYAALLADVLS